MMSFCLNFSHVSFMELMNGCSDTIWIYVIVFINDILAYSNTTEDYDRHLRFSLKRLREKKLYVKLLKCEFWLDCIAFQEHVEAKEGIRVYLGKIEAERGYTCLLQLLRFRVLWDYREITSDFPRASILLDHFLSY